MEAFIHRENMLNMLKTKVMGNSTRKNKAAMSPNMEIMVFSG